MAEYSELLTAAEGLVALLDRIEAMNDYSNREAIREIKRLHESLRPAYFAASGLMYEITTTYPPYIWVPRAREHAENVLAFLQAHDGWSPSPSPFTRPSGRAPKVPKAGVSAFLLMPFRQDMDWLRDAIVQAGSIAGVTVTRADDIFLPGVIIDQVRESIRRSDLVIGVCTERNPNVFYELGIADAENIPRILVAQDLGDLPFDVQHFRAVLYGDPGKQERRTFKDRLDRSIAEVIRDLPN